ncbi:hypothetical protein A9G42_05675 [Gilliamella sp. Nev6-6]|uniref:hypothetical protein n=1 Tax=Gilliamella sp. Nev6-6 TaxID=3120252 RepID=UPI00080F3A4C|nr:hypothetical protein [Gilliamella apicola]OCG77393.1 hypothetical protein A9G42_05675 [Gilliamella apicola]
MEHLNKNYKLKLIIDFIYTHSETNLNKIGYSLGLGANLITGLFLILEKAGVVLLKNEVILKKIEDKGAAEKIIDSFLKRNELYHSYQSNGLSFNELLKEATKLKKDKQYIDAYQLLRATLENAPKGQSIDPRVIVRLPYYLELNGNLEEALNECSRLLNKSKKGYFRVTEEKANTYNSEFLKFDSIFTSVPILTKMSSIFEKLGRFDESLYCEIQIYVMLGKYYYHFIENIVSNADDYANSKYMEFDSYDGGKILIERLPPSNQQVLAYTEKGNPIHDITYNYILKCRNNYLSISNMEKSFRKNCYKIGINYLLENIIEKVTDLIIDKELTDLEWLDELERWFEITVFKVTKNRT